MSQNVKTFGLLFWDVQRPIQNFIPDCHHPEAQSLQREQCSPSCVAYLDEISTLSTASSFPAVPAPELSELPMTF